MKACPHCGGPLKAGKSRSIDQHRRYFALIKHAFDQWPETHEFQPDNPEHLRKWLQVKAGYRTVQEIEITRTDPKSMKIIESTLRAAMKSLGDYAWTVIHGKKLYVVAALSVAFNKINHTEFSMLNTTVEMIIEREIGIKIDDLMKEVEAA
jgi:hypothetical protein